MPDEITIHSQATHISTRKMSSDKARNHKSSKNINTSHPRPAPDCNYREAATLDLQVHANSLAFTSGGDASELITAFLIDKAIYIQP